MVRRGRRGKSEDGANGPNPVDVHVGARIRLRRTLLGMSQSALGERIGLTFQQIQKYEKGSNRVSAAGLWRFGTILDVPVSFFFDGLADQEQRPKAVGDAEAEVAAAHFPMAKRETLELVRAYYRIKDLDLRRRQFDLIKAVAAACAAEDD